MHLVNKEYESFVKVIYYTECDQKPFEELATYINNNCRGSYLIKVWDKGNTVGMFQVK